MLSRLPISDSQIPDAIARDAEVAGSWVAISYLNSWVDLNAAVYYGASYRQNLAGTQVRGVASTPNIISANSIIGNLGVSFPRNRIFVVSSTIGFSRVDLGTTGNLTFLYNGTNIPAGGYISLELNAPT